MQSVCGNRHELKVGATSILNAVTTEPDRLSFPRAETGLREVRDDDIPLLFALRRDRGLQSMLLTIPKAEDDEALLAWIERRRGEPGGAFLAIENDGEAIGYIQVAQVHHKNRTGYGGIVIAEGRRGCGAGRAALHALLQFSRSRLGLRKLLAEIRSDNAPSIRLHLSLGYRVVGTLERHFADTGGEIHDVLLLERLLEEEINA